MFAVLGPLASADLLSALKSFPVAPDDLTVRLSFLGFNSPERLTTFVKELQDPIASERGEMGGDVQEKYDFTKKRH